MIDYLQASPSTIALALALAFALTLSVGLAVEKAHMQGLVDSDSRLDTSGFVIERNNKSEML